MLKQYENRNRTNENEVEENLSQGKGGIVKQFGLSSSQTGLNKSLKRNSEVGLKLKSNSQEIYKSKGDKSSQKQSLVPQKRTELNAGLKVRQEVKKQHKQSIEKTHRRREQEIEWAPEGLDLDFSSFGSSAHEVYSNPKEQIQIDLEDKPIKTRRFLVEQEDTTESLIESSTEQVIEHDTSTIEYGPKKEIELPYVPDESCIIDYNDFNGIADLSAYESIRLFDKDVLDFTFDDTDLDQLKPKCIDDHSLVFDNYYSEDEFDMTTDEDIDIPFNDYLFDVNQFIQCN